MVNNMLTQITRCRIELENLRHDEMASSADYNRVREINEKVDMIMGGDNEELIMEIVANNDAVAEIIKEICSIKLNGCHNVHNATMRTAMNLTRLAIQLNEAISENVKTVVEMSDI